MVDEHAEDMIPNFEITIDPPKPIEAVKRPGGEVDNEAVGAMLRSLSMFDEFPDAELSTVAHYFGISRFARDQAVFLEGDNGSAMFIIYRGKVLVRKRNFTGQGVEMATLAQGRVFGEMAVMDGDKRSATCQALEDCLMVTIEKASLDKLVAEAPVLGVKFMRVIARSLSMRLRTADGKLADQHL